MRVSVPQPLFPTCYATVVEARDGSLLGARVASDGQWRFPPRPVVPEKYRQALLHYEDKRFYYHPGIDPLSLLRAVGQNLRCGRIVSGGSTLTMQLARLSYGKKPRTWGQKLREANRALYLSWHYSKPQVLAMYAAQAPMGGNVVGVEAACYRYFGHAAEEISWAEAATLAVLPNAPGLLRPGKNRQALVAKRNRLLHTLFQAEILTQQEYALARAESLPELPLPLPNEAPHLTEYMRYICPNTRIHSSLHADLQRQLQQVVNEVVQQNTVQNRVRNAAVLVAEVPTGQVLAYVGNACTSTHPALGQQVDLIRSPRSTGSILKPVLYAAMLSEGELLPYTLVPDVPMQIQGFRPQNYGRSYAGAVPASLAVQRSLNVPLVRMLREYGVGRFLTLLRYWGLSELMYSENYYGLSLILGGAEASLWNLCGMYASLSRSLLAGRDARKSLSFDAESTDETEKNKTTLSAGALWYMTEVMSALNRPEEEADWQQFRSMKRIAWKTGTSSGGRDAWAIGFTSRYIVGVWMGNADGEGRPQLTGVGYAAPLLFQAFSYLPASAWFPYPAGQMEETLVCHQSGYKAGPLCTEVDTLAVPHKGQRVAVCPYHQRVQLSADGRWQVRDGCYPVGEMRVASWFVLPPAQEYYYRRQHASYRPIPPMKPGCFDADTPAMELLYPEPGAVVYLPMNFQQTQERCVLRVLHRNPDARLYWHLNGRYIGQTRGIHEIAPVLVPGRYTLSVVDEQGRMLRTHFEVKSTPGANP